MSGSSAKNLELNYYNPPPIQVDRGTGGASSNTLAAIQLPNFSGYVYADTARKAGRINAASISKAEHDALLSERQSLLDKKFDGSISRKEENRLEYVRWTLDRVEDATHGENMDRLESAVAKYEQFMEDVKSLEKEIAAIIKSSSRR